MSRGKFAAITSSLLVRKGEARPWAIAREDFSEFDSVPNPAFDRARAYPPTVEMSRTASAAWGHGETHDEEWTPPQRPAAPSASPVPAAPPSVAPAADEHPKRCTLKLTHQEYERLGIIAVKREITRAHVLREAIQQYLDAARRDAPGCECLGRCSGAC